MKLPSVSDVLAVLLGPVPQAEPEPRVLEAETAEPRTRDRDRTLMPFFDDPEDPYSTHTVMGWIRSWKLGKALEAGYNDQAAIDRDYAQMVAASDARDAQFWADMRADGVPVADPEPDPEPGSFADRYAAAAAEAQAGQWVADHTPAAEVSADGPEAGAAPGPENEPVPEAEAEPDAEPEASL
jgi:hypothetical protein